jgi:hypothetical protein
MNGVDLLKFISKNDIEYHWSFDKKEIYLFVNITDIQEWNDLLGASIFDDEGLSCVMKDGYFAFEMVDICEYYGIDYQEIFEKENE